MRPVTELVDFLSTYHDHLDGDQIKRAYAFGQEKHQHQTRASGEAYFSHPIEVAFILAHMRLDAATIITALLHDTIEDTDATFSDLQSAFGDEVSALVDGVTKLSRLELQSDQTMQAENFRKLLLAMSEDIRVLLVKLADRLHNMRTLQFIKNPEKRRRIAHETTEIYAPLAGRIGMDEMKHELEELAFQELHPQARDSITKRLAYLKEANIDIVPQLIKALTKVLSSQGIESNICGREKTPYSIWRKMQIKNIEFEQLSDIIAFRVIVGKVEDCYQALGILHSHFLVLPGRFKDYISTPKRNGYSSIHTGLIGPYNKRIEVQIRTHSMDEVNEWGVAAHWHYKKGGNEKPGDICHDGRQFKWLRQLLDILENAHDTEEFFEHTKLEMYQDQVFCFSPKGDLITLPSGATPVDFAYAVHSEVGNRCKGVRINGKMLPLRTLLKNGDQVEVITSGLQTPSPSWEKFVVTGKAKACIRRFLRHNHKEDLKETGQKTLENLWKKLMPGKPFAIETEKLNDLFDRFNYKTLDDILAAVGEGLVSPREFLNTLDHDLKHNKPSTPQISEDTPPLPTPPMPKPEPDANNGTIIGLIPGMAMRYAGCCHPIPGDKIVGIITTGRGVTIHTCDCTNLKRFDHQTERWLDISWNTNLYKQADQHIARFHSIISNTKGALGEFSSLIGRQSVNIVNLKIINRTEEIFEILIDLEVDNAEQTKEILGFLRSSPVVQSIERSKY